MAHILTHYRACNLCEAICGLEIKTEGDKVISIKGDPADPLSRGHICPKAVALQDVYNDPDRLRTPVRRTASGWESIGWEEALDEVAEGIRSIQERYGPDALGLYFGNPNVHNAGSLLFGPMLTKALKTRNRFSATSVDQLPHHVAALLMFGHYLLIPIPDIDRTDYFLALGANPLVSNGSLMTSPDMPRRLRDLQQRGGRLVVIDPRRTETAEAADEHLFIRPASDALFLLALIHTLFDEGLINRSRLEAFTDGIGTVRQIVLGFPPEAVAAHTGIPAADIRRLAREFAAAPSAVAYGRIGLSVQAFGGLCQWLINVLNIVTGNVDRPGGAMFTRPAFDLVGQQGATGKHGSFGRWHSRIRKLPEFGGELPVSALAEDILGPGEGPIRGMVTVAGNPVLSTPGGLRLDEAFGSLEFMAAIDIYINETTRHAHVILPPATGLETSHYDLIFHVLAIRNTAKYSPPTFEKSPEQRYDWEIIQALLERLTGQASNGLNPDLLLAMGLQYGPYAKEGLTLDKIKADPHGVDLGPLQPCLPERLLTPEKRINLAPEQILADIPRLLKSMENASAASTAPLTLISRRELRSCNSWMHNSNRLIKGRNRCTLLIHPADAGARGIADGQTVRVSSQTGEITLPAQVSEQIMPGVVSIPHGYGHDRHGVRLRIAQTNPGASINDLTDPAHLDELTGNAALNGIEVEVRL